MQLIHGHDSVTPVPLIRNIFAANPAAAVAAAVWHGRQLTPMMFSAELICPDLRDLIPQSSAQDTSCLQVLLSVNVPHGYRMLSDDFIAERLGPDVCKIILALDAADIQPVRFDFTNAPRRCVSFCRFHVDGEGVPLLLHL